MILVIRVSEVVGSEQNAWVKEALAAMVGGLIGGLAGVLAGVFSCICKRLIVIGIREVVISNCDVACKDDVFNAEEGNRIQ